MPSIPQSPVPQPADDPDGVSDFREDEQVRLWLLECFERLAFSEEGADLLASARADWHRAEELLERGCSHAVALRILS